MPGRPPPGASCYSGESRICTTCKSRNNRCPSSNAANENRCPGTACQAGSPINLGTSNTYIEQTDIRLPEISGGLTLVRTWNSERTIPKSLPCTIRKREECHLGVIPVHGFVPGIDHQFSRIVGPYPPAFFVRASWRSPHATPS